MITRLSSGILDNKYKQIQYNRVKEWLYSEIFTVSGGGYAI